MILSRKEIDAIIESETVEFRYTKLMPFANSLRVMS
jgi:hypothetical protein